MNSFLSTWTLHAPELRRWLLSRLPVKSEVDDLLQDVFLKTLKQGDRLSSVELPRAWLYEITRNTLIDRLRAAHDSFPLPDDLDELPASEEQTDTVDNLAQICLPRVLSELNSQDREAIQLCDLQGMAQADFAKLKNLSLPAAKSRVQRARRRMREHMTSACQLSFDQSGRVDDFVPRAPLPGTGCAESAPLNHGKPT